MVRNGVKKLIADDEYKNKNDAAQIGIFALAYG